MSPVLRIGGAWRPIVGAKVFLGGSWRTVSRGIIYKGGAWHPLFNFVSTLSASVAPSYAYGEGNSTQNVIVSSDTLTVTPSGGLAPYTYSWTAPGVTIRYPSRSSTDFYAVLAAGQEIDTTASCTVTDSLGATASVSEPVTLFNNP